MNCTCTLFHLFSFLSKPARDLNKSSDPLLRLRVCVRVIQTETQKEILHGSRTQADLIL